MGIESKPARVWRRQEVELRGGKERHEGPVVRRGLLMETSKSELVEVSSAVTTLG